MIQMADTPMTVLKAAVFGLPDRLLGEVVAAAVSLVPGASQDIGADLIAHCQAQLSGYKVQGCSVALVLCQLPCLTSCLRDSALQTCPCCPCLAWQVPSRVHLLESLPATASHKVYFKGSARGCKAVYHASVDADTPTAFFRSNDQKSDAWS